MLGIDSDDDIHAFQQLLLELERREEELEEEYEELAVLGVGFICYEAERGRQSRSGNSGWKDYVLGKRVVSHRVACGLLWYRLDIVQ